MFVRRVDELRARGEEVVELDGFTDVDVSDLNDRYGTPIPAGRLPQLIGQRSHYILSAEGVAHRRPGKAGGGNLRAAHKLLWVFAK